MWRQYMPRGFMWATAVAALATLGRGTIEQRLGENWPVALLILGAGVVARRFVGPVVRSHVVKPVQGREGTPKRPPLNDSDRARVLLWFAAVGLVVPAAVGLSGIIADRSLAQVVVGTGVLLGVTFGAQAASFLVRGQNARKAP